MKSEGPRVDVKAAAGAKTITPSNRATQWTFSRRWRIRHHPWIFTLMDFLLIGLYLKWPLRKQQQPPGCCGSGGRLAPLWWCSVLGMVFLRMASLSEGVQQQLLCPRPCRCDGKLLYCEGLNLTDLPRNVSGGGGLGAGIAGLSMRENNLTELRWGHFAGLSQLTWLYLDRNGIDVVEEGAFDGLRRLKELDLSGNRVEALPNGTFRPLPNLRVLDLSRNRLQALEPDLFHGLRKLTNLRLRYNALKFVPVRIFQDCRSMELLDLGHNRLQSLARNSFAGLFKLTELHLEHNELVKVNLAHFPRLISLRALYLHGNLATTVVSTLPDWTWHHLEKIDLSRNRIEHIDAHAFEGAPALRMLLLDCNRLTALDGRVLASWRTLESVTLAGNEWDCGGRNVCALAQWLSAFRGARGGNAAGDGPLLCSSPDAAQGEDVLDAVYAFQLCEEDDGSLATTAGPFASTRDRGPYPRPAAFLTPNLYEVGGEVVTVSFAVAVTPGSGHNHPLLPEDLESAMQIHKVVTGTMALIFSFLIVVLMLYVAWKCFPAGVRQARQCLSSQRRRQKQKQSMQQMAAGMQAGISAPEYYVDYKPNHMEGALVIINEYGSTCTCQQQPLSKECEV